MVINAHGWPDQLFRGFFHLQGAISQPLSPDISQLRQWPYSELIDIKYYMHHTSRLCRISMMMFLCTKLLLEYLAIDDVNWPKCDSPLTSLDVHIENSYVYMRIFIHEVILGSILIPWWVPEHSFIYLIFDIYAVWLRITCLEIS